MDQFNELRRQGRERKNNAIAVAREEHRQSMLRIKQLEHTFVVKGPKVAKPQPMSALMCNCLPRDRLFTIAELLYLMELAEPGRVIPQNSARSQFHMLKRQGAVRRVKRDGGRQVLFAVASYKVPETRYGAINMLQVAESILRELGPRTLADMIVTLQTRGGLFQAR